MKAKRPRTSGREPNLGSDLVEAFDEMAAYLRGEVAVEAYEVPDETLHLLSNPANAKILLRSIADVNSGKLIEHDL
jgi:hypothetical protein